MSVATASDLCHKQLVAVKQRPCFADPPQRLGMAGVPSGTVVHGEDVPQSVQLTVLAEEMLAAKDVRGDVPNSHRVRLTTGFRCPHRSARNPISWNGFWNGHMRAPRLIGGNGFAFFNGRR